ncbi:MAG TPA: hypothetical protein VK997_13510 [Deferrisomatales bacterium]|nr:hypothetical protein [Deferrisomatales bacterium]
MYKVKTFGTELQAFQVHRELEKVDLQVNEFFARHPEYRLVGVNDMPLTDDNGATQGLIRVVAYEE